MIAEIYRAGARRVGLLSGGSAGSGDDAGQIYQPTGPELLRPANQERILAAVLGRDLHFAARPDPEGRQETLTNTLAEYVDAFFDFCVAGTLDESQVRDTVQVLTRRAPRTFEQCATAHADVYR